MVLTKQKVEWSYAQKVTFIPTFMHSSPLPFNITPPLPSVKGIVLLSEKWAILDL